MIFLQHLSTVNNLPYMLPEAIDANVPSATLESRDPISCSGPHTARSVSRTYFLYARKAEAADTTWSGPGGWMKAIQWAVQMRRTKSKQSEIPGRLWFILALPSVGVFIS